jgi:hypothetical protein
MPGLSVLNLGCFLFGDWLVAGQFIEIGDDAGRHPKNPWLRRGWIQDSRIPGPTIEASQGSRHGRPARRRVA